MLKLVRKIGNCNSASLWNILGNVLYRIDNISYLNENNLNKALSILNFSNYNNEVYYSENSILYKLEKNTLSRVLDLGIEQIDKIEKITEDTYLSIELFSEDENIYRATNNNNKIIWSLTGDFYLTRYGNYLMSQGSIDEKSITILDIKSGNPLWTYKLPKGYKIYGELQLYKNRLIVPQIDIEENKELIVCLDIKTGKTVWELDKGNLYSKQKGNMLYGFTSTIFGDNYYTEINIETGELFEKSFANYKKSVNSNLAMIKDDFLYYSLYKEGGIGIIDINTKEMIAEHSLGLEEGVSIGAPVVIEDKLYVLDSTNVLHIYERP